MPQPAAPASSLISGAIKAASERAKAEEMNVVMDDDSMILSDSDGIEYAQPYNKYGVRGGFIAREANMTQLDQLLRRKSSVPGVGAYTAEVVEDKMQTLRGAGGRLDKAERVQEVEAIMNKAKTLPGPGQYAVLHDLIGPAACARPHALAVSHVQRPPSAIVSGRGFTNLDIAIRASAASPGPCRYEKLIADASIQPHSPGAVFGTSPRMMSGFCSAIVPSIDNDPIGLQPNGTGSHLGPGAFSPELNLWTSKPSKDASASLRKGGGGALNSRVVHMMSFDGQQQALAAHPHAGVLRTPSARIDKAANKNVFELEIQMRAGNHGPGKYDAHDLRYSTVTGHYDSRSYKMATSKRLKKTVPILAAEHIAPGPGAYHPETTNDLAWRISGAAHASASKGLMTSRATASGVPKPSASKQQLQIRHSDDMSPGAGAGGEVPREIKDMLHIACNPPPHLLQRRPRFCMAKQPWKHKAAESMWEMEGALFKGSPLVDICNGNDSLRPSKKETKEWRHSHTTISSGSSILRPTSAAISRASETEGRQQHSRAATPLQWTRPASATYSETQQQQQQQQQQQLGAGGSRPASAAGVRPLSAISERQRMRYRPALVKGYNSDIKALVLNFTKGNEFNDFAEGKIGYLKIQQHLA